MERITFIIQTFTMNPDFGEDRIRLDAVDPAGAYQAIWYTRRLADRFLPHLAAHAEKRVQAGLPRDIVLSMNQQALHQERQENPLPPVQPTVEVTPWLCRTVHLNQHPGGVQWTMTDDASIDAHMILADDAVRAVLDVFLATYRALEWAETPFPEWVRDAVTAPVQDRGTLN